MGMGDTITSTPAGQAPAGAQPQGGNVTANNVQPGQVTVQAGAQPQEGGNGVAGAQVPVVPVQGQPSAPTLSPEAMAAELARVRQEAAALRVENKGYKDAQLTDAQRQAQRLTELEQAMAARDAELQHLRVARAVEGQARQTGCIDPEMAMMAIQPALQFDAEGRPTNVAAALDALRQSKPYLFGQTGAGAGAPVAPAFSGSAANPARGANASVFTRSQLADVNFYAANQAAVDAAIREGRIIEG